MSMSLRKLLMCWLMPLYLLVAVLATVYVYWQFGRTTNLFMDDQMRSLAHSYANAELAPPPLPPQDPRSMIKWGSLIVQLWSPGGGRLLSSSMPSLELPLQALDGFADRVSGGRLWRVYTLHNHERAVQVAQLLDFRHHVVKGQALRAGFAVALLIPLSGLALWFALHFALRPLENVARAARAQNERTLSELPLERVPTEIRPLVESMNHLLARLREAFAAQQRFVQDAAHELRTPITALALQLEHLRTRLPPGEADALAQLDTGVQRMRRLVEQLLRLARQDAPRPQPQRIDLQALLAGAIQDLMPLADHRRIDLGLDSDASAPQVQAAPEDLRSLFDNLLDNALRYAPEGGVVDVRLRAVAGAPVVEIADNGPGIPQELLPRVFDRFFRILGRDGEGSGLGLAIAHGAAGRSGVQVELHNRRDGGLVARVTFAAA